METENTDVKIYQKNRHDPLQVAQIEKIEYYTIAEDEKQSINNNFSSFSLNNVVVEVKFIGKNEAITIRPEVIESLHFFPHSEFDDNTF